MDGLGTGKKEPRLAAVISILSPQGTLASGAGALAERLPTLDGAVLGFIDNGKPNTDLLFERLRRRLSERFRLVEVRAWLERPDRDVWLPVTGAWDRIADLVAGGPGKRSTFLPAAGRTERSRAPSP